MSKLTNLRVTGKVVMGNNDSSYQMRLANIGSVSNNNLRAIEFTGTTVYQFKEMVKVIAAWIEFCKENEDFPIDNDAVRLLRDDNNVWKIGHWHESYEKIVTTDKDKTVLDLKLSDRFIIGSIHATHFLQFARLFWVLRRIANHNCTSIETKLVTDQESIDAYIKAHRNTMYNARSFLIMEHPMDVFSDNVDCALPKKFEGYKQMLTFKEGWKKFIEIEPKHLETEID